MKRRFLAVLATGLFFLCATGLANAALTTIGTVAYGSSNYNLIWDDENNGNSVVWLDYTNPLTSWTSQNTWAAELDSVLAYNIDSAYTVTWDDDAWRLPSAGTDFSTSEVGDLFYNESMSSFGNLTGLDYWSGTKVCTGYAFIFNIQDGGQRAGKTYFSNYGLAIRSGQVSAVPVPGAIWLLGSGMAGLVALGRSRKGNSV